LVPHPVLIQQHPLVDHNPLEFGQEGT
jgi:hypothetical protein